MPETCIKPDSPARSSETSAIATLRELNAESTRAFVESNIPWYADHLSEDFILTAGNGARIDRTEFLGRMAEEPGVNSAEQAQIEVRAFGETALVHGISHYTFDQGATSTRFTDVWHLDGGLWRLVAAHVSVVKRA